MQDHSTRIPSFPTNLQDYAPWVATYGLTAPYGECQCGCGGRTRIATANDSKTQVAKGKPVRFLRGHHPKRQAVPRQACANCGRVQKLKAHGECATCYNHRRKYGTARPPDRPVGHVRGQDSPHWKGEGATPHTKRNRARSRYDLGPCQNCGKPGVDRHHVDGDTGNNTPKNVMILCRHCHMEMDGRLERFKANRNATEVMPPQPCINCGRVVKPRRLGRCASCREYLKRHGRDKPCQ